MKTLFKLIVTTFFLCVLAGNNFAQTYFQKVYASSPYEQEAQDVLPMPDGGYLLAGYTTNSTLNDCDIQLMKVDAVGNQLWVKTFGGAKPDFPYHMLATNDGNYFLIGWSQSYGGGDYDMLLLKVDPSGNLIWQKTYGGFGNDQARDIIPTTDGNYLIVGWSNSSGPGAQNANLVKIDPAGNQIWSKMYGGSANDYGTCVKQCSDGGYVVLGQTYSFGVGSGDTYLVKTDGNGNEVWTKTYGGAHADEGMYITVNPDNSLMLLIRDSSNAGKDIDTRLTKTDASGNEIWSKVYGGTEKDTPKMLQPTSDGGYIAACISRSFGWLNPDMWFLKFNSAGDTTWTRHYGGYNHEHAYVARELSDGSFISCGKTNSYGPNADAIFLKLNSNGTLAVGVEEFMVSENTIRVFPNPSNGNINLELNGTEPGKVSICDALGREVYLKEFDKERELKIQLAYQPGLYIIRCESGSGIASKKLIIN